MSIVVVCCLSLFVVFSLFVICHCLSFVVVCYLSSFVVVCHLSGVQVVGIAWPARVVLVIKFVNAYGFHGLNNQIIQKT